MAVGRREARAKGALAAEMVPVATELVCAVHDHGVEEVAAVLAKVPRAHMVALTVVLAALVDPDRPISEALAWVTWDEHGKPLQRLVPVEPPVPPAQAARRFKPPVGDPPVWEWDGDTLRAAHAAYARGDRSFPVSAGEREYHRRRKARRRQPD
jgi:hypothetical protein